MTAPQLVLLIVLLLEQFLIILAIPAATYGPVMFCGVVRLSILLYVLTWGGFFA